MEAINIDASNTQPRPSELPMVGPCIRANKSGSLSKPDDPISVNTALNISSDEASKSAHVGISVMIMARSPPHAAETSPSRLNRQNQTVRSTGQYRNTT